LRQQPIPVLIFPIRVVLVAGIHLIISLVIAMVLTASLIGIPIANGVNLAHAGTCIRVCLGIGLATISGLLHTHFADTKHLLEIVLQALYFLTPVIYRPQMFDDRIRMSWIVVTYNPLNSVLELVRQPMLSGEYAETLALAAGDVIIKCRWPSWLCGVCISWSVAWYFGSEHSHGA